MSVEPRQTAPRARSLVENLLDDVRFLTLSTVDGSGPWACTLAFAYDDGFDLYAISKQDTRHVQAIEETVDVAANVHDVDRSPQEGPRRIRGLQTEGTGEVLRGPSVARGLAVFARRFAGASELDPAELDVRGTRVCRIRPERLVYLERGEDSYRFELTRRAHGWNVEPLPELASPLGA